MPTEQHQQLENQMYAASSDAGGAVTVDGYFVPREKRNDTSSRGVQEEAEIPDVAAGGAVGEQMLRGLLSTLQ